MLKPVLLKTIDFPRHSGLGYHQWCIKEAFPDMVETMNYEDCLEEDLFVVTLLYHFTPNPEITPFHELWGALFKSKAFVVGSFIWEFPQLPESIIRRQPRVDLFHVHSSFLRELLEPYPTFLAPLPIKPFPYKRKTQRSYTIGGVVSAHPRKNVEGWLALREKLPAKWKIILLAEKDLAISPKGDTLKGAGIELLHSLSDEELAGFYQSLDWFISLSTGEGYSLPPREALKCGTPVILGAHTGHLDLQGLDGVFLVPCEEVAGDKHFIPTSLVFNPNIDEVVRIVEEVPPPQVPENLPLPNMEQWRKTWQNILQQASQGREKKVTMLKEVAAYFVLYPTQVGGGLNWSSQTWGERVGCGYIYYPKVERVNKPIIVPLHEGLVNSLLFHQFAMFLTALKERNEDVPIVAWLHHFLNPGSSLWSLLRGCCTHISTTLPSPPFLHLPLPIGNPPQREASRNYFLYWGYNPLGWDAAIALAEQLKVHLKILASPHAHWKPDYPLAFYARKQKGIDMVFHTSFSQEELEKYLDEAQGYIIIDIGGVEGEVSGRVATVLRKKKPILANYSLRTAPFRGIIPLLSPLPGDGLHLSYWAANAARSVERLGLHYFIPKEDAVPPVETEIAIFHELLTKVAHS